MMTDPNRFAGAAEAALLRDEIAADTAILTAVSTRIAASKATLHAAERAFQEAKEQLEAAQQACAAHESDYASKAERLHVMRGRLHPIRRLPAEVLGEIFEAFLDAEAAAHPDGSDKQWHHLSLAPNTVAQVCRRWRSVACDMPRLWRFISVVFRDDVESMDEEWIAALAARIARSGTTLARLLIRGPFPDYDTQYEDELPGYEPAGWIGPRHIWRPLIALAPRCQAIRIVIISTQVFIHRMGPLLENDAPGLEDLAICLRPLEDLYGFSDACDPPSPNFCLNLKAPKLRRVAFEGVRPYVLVGPSVFVYPEVTDACIAINKDFERGHVNGLMRRLPSLAHLTLENFALPNNLSLEWFSHTGVRHLSIPWPSPWFSAGAAGPETFPALESVNVDEGAVPSTLAVGFAATGPLHAIRSLSLGVRLLDDELVRTLDLLPRLESVLLRGGTIARSFVEDATWIRPPAVSRNWRCPALQEMRLASTKEISPVPPQPILTWLSSRNSSSGAGTHRAIRAFQVGWESLTWSQAQMDDFEDKIKLLLKK